jgi:hypothetical protein
MNGFGYRAIILSNFTHPPPHNDHSIYRTTYKNQLYHIYIQITDEVKIRTVQKYC